MDGRLDEDGWMEKKDIYLSCRVLWMDDWVRMDKCRGRGEYITIPYLLLRHPEPVPVVRPRRALIKVPIQGRESRGPGPLVVGVHVLWEAGEPDRELGLLHLLIWCGLRV